MTWFTLCLWQKLTSLALAVSKGSLETSIRRQSQAPSSSDENSERVKTSTMFNNFHLCSYIIPIPVQNVVLASADFMECSPCRNLSTYENSFTLKRKPEIVFCCCCWFVCLFVCLFCWYHRQYLPVRTLWYFSCKQSNVLHMYKDDCTKLEKIPNTQEIKENAF